MHTHAKRTRHSFDPMSNTWQVLVYGYDDQVIKVAYFCNEPEAMRFIESVLCHH